MEAGKSHSLLSASWKHRKAGDAIQSAFQGLRVGVRGWCESWAERTSPRTRCVSVPGQKKMGGRLSSERANLALLCIFVLLRPSDWLMFTCLGESVFTQSTDSDVTLPDTPPKTHLELMFYQLPGRQLAQAS